MEIGFREAVVRIVAAAATDCQGGYMVQCFGGTGLTEGKQICHGLHVYPPELFHLAKMPEQRRDVEDCCRAFRECCVLGRCKPKMRLIQIAIYHFDAVQGPGCHLVCTEKKVQIVHEALLRAGRTAGSAQAKNRH